MSEVIKNEQQYSAAMARVYELMQADNDEGSEGYAELEALSSLVKDYELVHYPLPSSNP